MGAKHVVAGALFPLGSEWCALVDPEDETPLEKYEIDCRCVVLNKKDGIIRAHPLIRRWRTHVQFEYNPDFLKPEWVTDLFVLAGRIIGWLDYRPGKGFGGPYGRFKVQLLSA
jgi:hypothetical protein